MECNHILVRFGELTTKGKNHGKGLYYVNKLINKYKWIETSQMFLNNYFIQKITIK